MELYHNQMIGQVETAINDLQRRKGRKQFSGITKYLTPKNILIFLIVLFIGYQIYMGAKVKKIGIPNIFEIELDYGNE